MSSAPLKKKCLLLVLVLSVPFAVAGERASVRKGEVRIYDGSLAPGKPGPFEDLPKKDQASLRLDPVLGLLVLKGGVPETEVTRLERECGVRLLSADAVALDRNLDRVQDYFARRFGWSGFDGKGSPLLASVNSGELAGISDFDLSGNAAYVPSLGALAFGIADPGAPSFVSRLDVVAHEFTHAFLRYAAGLTLDDPEDFLAIALQEHLADVFGVLVRHNYEPRANDLFLIGGSREADGERVAVIRDMTKETTLLAALQGRQEAHALAEVPNFAAYLIIRKLGWARSERLFFNVVIRRLRKSDGLLEYRKAMEAECKSLYSSRECRIVSDAFRRVEIRPF